MPSKRSPEPKGPDWTPEKTLKVLRQQREELERIKSLRPLEAYKQKEGWTQVTQAAIVHGFGENSQNLTNFHFAHYAARHKDQLADFLAVTGAHETALNSAIKELEFMLPEDETIQAPEIHAPNSSTHRGILVFISHSSKDAELALALIELLKAGLGLQTHQILCSSVDGYRLPVGVNTEAKLRQEVNAARIVIGLITPSSLASAFVMFELGARWGANQFLAPLLAGVRPSELSGPLTLLNALSASNEAQLHQLLADISQKLDQPLQNAASYVRYVAAVRKLSERIPTSAVGSSAEAAGNGAKKKLRLSLSVVGTPPSPQMLRVQSNQLVKAIRLEYLLSNGASIASDTLDAEGESFDVPIEDHQVLKLWNTPRADRNPNDHSGPARLRLTLAINDAENSYTVPVQMDSYYHLNTYYRKLNGAEMFHGE